MVTEKMIEGAKGEAKALADRAGIDIGDDRDMFVDDLAQTLTRFAALSTDSEPVAYLATHKEHGDQLFSAKNADKLARHYSANRWSFTPLYAAPPAPSVVVKALEWRIFCSKSLNRKAETPFGEYVIQSEGSIWQLWFPGNEDEANGSFDTADDAEQAAQNNFESRIRSALSAQVQDVAIPEGWKKTPERYSNYPWSVDLYADGWHLSNHDFGATSRDISVHETAAQAMTAAPAAKQGEAE